MPLKSFQKTHWHSLTIMNQSNFVNAPAYLDWSKIVDLFFQSMHSLFLNPFDFSVLM